VGSSVANPVAIFSIKLARRGAVKEEFSVARMTGTSLSRDGRQATLKFLDQQETEIWLNIAALSLTTMVQEMGALFTRSRELSDISRANVVQFLRPQRIRADLVTKGSTVVASFELDNGLQQHFGMEPSLAEALAQQLLDAAQRGRKANLEQRH
jgi:hypothetical protein